MIKITKIKISKFRSILNLSFDVDESVNIISICGENNVGKTNTLRAINLFFHPEEYDSSIDRPTLKENQRGANIDPKIEIEFLDDNTGDYYLIKRDLKLFEYMKNKGISGSKYKMSTERKTRNSKVELEEKEILNFLERIEFRYIESINIDIPNLIQKLTDDVIDVEYEKARFSNSKVRLKIAYEEYTKGLQQILDSFASSISETFLSFKENWNVKMNIPTSSERFRDLINDNVELQIDDRGSTGVEEKGSGLQRLAVIILHFEILKRMKNKRSFIVCVDEPDIYLHEGLQRKLRSFFDENSENGQIFLTTHSKIFIDQYSLRNVILEDAKYYEQYSHRKKKNVNVIETEIINIQEDNGYKLICEHLGIENNTYDILDRNNILVEGECDIKYILELCKYFQIKPVKMISLDGISNAEKYLSFYNSYYNSDTNYKPIVKILFDNDNAGRQAYKKISSQKYANIDIRCLLVKNFNDTSCMELDNNNSNNEIEDLVYPEIMCFLVNKILEKKSMNIIDIKKVVDSIVKDAFCRKGVLDLIEHEKNNANPDKGGTISFTSSGSATNDIKKGLAGLFNVTGDYKLVTLLGKCNKKYPFVHEYIKELFKFNAE